MARSFKYDPKKDYQKLAEDYLQICGREQTKLPKISEFCREYIKANEDTVNKWIKQFKNKNLVGAIKRVKEAQMEQLMDDGMYGGKEVNQAMAIFLLKANHGMIETDRIVHEGEGLLIKLDAGNNIQPTSKVSSETA